MGLELPTLLDTDDRFYRRMPRPPNAGKKTPSGKHCCQWCGEVPAPPRRTWCSDECVDRWRERTDPNYIRIKVFERDAGVCALCGFDTEKATRILELLNGGTTRQYRKFVQEADALIVNDRRVLVPSEDWRGQTIQVWRSRSELMRAALGDEIDRLVAKLFRGPDAARYYRDQASINSLYPFYRSSHSVRWEADHIVPVAEGGGSCGLANYRTLCIKCHGVESGKLRKRLNQRRKNEKEQQLQFESKATM